MLQCYSAAVFSFLHYFQENSDMTSIFLYNPFTSTIIEKIHLNPLHSDGLAHYILIKEVWNSPFCILRGHWLKFLNYDALLSLKIVLSKQTVLTQMKCRLLRHFILVFTVCQSTCLPVSRMKRVKGELSRFQGRQLQSLIA